MGEIRLSVGQINISNYLIVNIREVGNPTAIVDSLVVPPPVPTTQNILFSGLNNVVHYVDFRESPDGIAQGTLLSTFVYDVQNQTIIAERRYYTTDGPGTYDPVEHDNAITDPYLNGKTVYGVFKEAFRYLKPTSEWTQIGDTVNLLAYNDLQTGEVVAIEINYTVNQASGSAASFPIDIVEITANTTLDSTHYDKMIEANGSSTILIAQFPDLLTIPDGKKFLFNTHKGDQRYLQVNMTSGYIQVDGEQRSVIWLGKGEECELIKKGGYLRVISWPGDRKRVGEVVKGDKTPLNGVAETGLWVDIDTEYPRLYYDYVNDLDPSVLGTGTYPTTPSGANAQKWCIDVANNKFWIPNSGGYFDRNTDPDGDVDTERSSGDRKPGTIQGDQVGQWTFAGVKMQKSGTSNRHLVLQNLTDVDLGTQDITFNTGKETRGKNINRNAYRII